MSFAELPSVPEQFRPIALIIKSQGDDLPNVNEEVEAVRQNLEDKGFGVLQLDQPVPAEIMETFRFEASYNDTQNDELESTTSIFTKKWSIFRSWLRFRFRLRLYPQCDVSSLRNRIAVFHYAGHSTQDSLSLPKWEQENGSRGGQFFFEGLAGFLSRESSLRLVFINGCHSKGFERYFRSNRAASVSAHAPIPDETAKQFAIDFYENWSGHASVEEAYHFAKNKNLATESTSQNADQTRNILDAAGAKHSFPWTLSNWSSSKVSSCFAAVLSSMLRSSRLNPRPRLKDLPSFAWVVILFFLGITSLVFAYLTPWSSPAFQAEFGYAVSDQQLEQLASKEIWDLIAATGLPTRGFFIESFRLGLGLLILYFAFYLFGSPFDWRDVRKKEQIWLLIFWVVVLVALGTYHWKSAPSSLETSSTVWLIQDVPADTKVKELKDERFLRFDEDIWSNAGNAWKSRLPNFKEKERQRLEEKERQRLEEREKGPDEKNQLAQSSSKNDSLKDFDKSLFNRLYLYPYLFYSLYSVILFGVIGIGLLFVTLIQSLRAFRRTRFLLDAIEQSPNWGHDSDEQVLILNGAHKILRLITSRYALFLCLLLIGMCYEFSFGFLTLADSAKSMALLAFLLLFGGMLYIAFTFFDYNERFQQLDNPPDECQTPSDFLKDPVIFILFTLIATLFGYILLLRPWSFLF